MGNHYIDGAEILPQHIIDQRNRSYECMIEEPPECEETEVVTFCPHCETKSLRWEGWHYQCHQCWNRFDPDLNKIRIEWIK